MEPAKTRAVVAAITLLMEAAWKGVRGVTGAALPWWSTGGVMGPISARRSASVRSTSEVSGWVLLKVYTADRAA
jgi:hypothetical protein